MKIRLLLLAVSLFMFILVSGGQASAYSTPPSWMPMTMLDINFDAVTNKLAIVPTTFAAPLSTNTSMMGGPAAGVAGFDPAQPYAVLNGTAFSRRFGWNDANEMTAAAILPAVQAYYGPGANIWIQSLSQSPGLNTYQAIGSDGLDMSNTYPLIFGYNTSDPKKWKWDGMMDHNTNAVAFSSLTKPNQFFSAYYKIYVGDATGNELLVDKNGVKVASAATDTIWGWQGPPFVFTSQTGVATSTSRESDVYTHTDANTTIAITGGDGEYAISTDGGTTWGAWTAVAGTINTNDKVKVRQTSSATAGAPTTTTLAIPTANGSGAFRVTTLGQITTPSAFSFTSQTAVATSTPIESSSITVAGINAPAAISISAGGEYAVSTDNGISWGTYSSTLPATVANGNKVKVHQTSSPNPGVTTTVTLTIGGVSGAFVVTTGNPVTPSLSFTPVTNAPANTSVSGMPFSVTSNAITVTADSTISVAGGITPQYQVSTDGGVSWSAASTTTPTTVATGNLVKVRVVPATTPFTTSVTNLNLGGTVASFSVTTGFMNPPSWMPMAMLNVAFNTGTKTLSVQAENTHPSFSGGTLPALTYIPAGSYDPTKPWNAVNGGVAISRQLGWDDNTALHGSGITVPGSLPYQVQAAYPGASIWIERISQSPGLETYFADGMFGVGGTSSGALAGTPQPYSNMMTGLPIVYANNYNGIFGTDGSPIKWKWDGTMIHNVYAVPAAYITTANQVFTATYKIYVGDANGAEVPAAATASATTTWSWKGPATVPDTTPDVFSFTSQTGATLTTVVESSSITVAGLNVPVSISITGGEYSVSTDGTTWGSYSTTTPVTVVNGNQVKVRLTSSATSETAATATLTIGGGTGTFSVTTGDSVPDAFTFTNLTDVATDLYFSNAITVSGITIPSPVSISTGSRYSVSTDSGTTWSAYSATTPAKVNNGDQVKVRLTSAQTPNTLATATLIIGGVSGSFSVTTNAFSGPPTWMPMTMLNISLTAGKLAIQELSSKSPFNTTPPSYPALTAPVSTFDPGKPWYVINGSTFSRRLGWNPASGFNAAAVTAAFGADASIWIEKISQTPGLETYQAVGTYGVNANGSTTVDPAANGYAPIFGTAGSSTKWKWDYMMDHNTYAVPAAYITSANQLFSATYKIYVGDAAGVEIPAAASASTTTTWGWQGPSFVFPTKINQEAGAVIQSSYIRLSGAAAGPQAISVTGGEYAIWPSAGMDLGPWTTAPGTVSNGDWVIVRVSASSTPGATATAALSIASLAGPGTFKVITAAAAGSLAPITFTSKTNVEPSTLVEATESYTVPVIDAPAIIGVSSGSFAVSSDGGTTWGAWASVGTVTSGDKVKVRFTSSEAASTAASTTLTIVGVASGTFTATTNAFAGPPTWMPMTMLDVSLSGGKLAIVAAPTMYPVLSAASALTTFDPTKPWAVLNGSAYSRELGWNPAMGLDAAAVTAAFGSTATIWIERVSQSAGLETYQAVGENGVNANDTTTVDLAANGYAPIFGTAGSSTKWKWDYQMDHNTYAVPAAYITTPNKQFSATYKIYVGDTAGVEIPAAASASTTTTWTWQGPATVPDTTPTNFTFSAKVGATGSVLESAPISVAGIDSTSLISITGGEYSVSINGGSSWSAYSTATPATVATGNQVKVRQTASTTSGAETSATLAIGGVTGSFSVTAVQRNGSSGTGTAPSIGDALKALQGYHDPSALTPAELVRYDVAPLTAGGTPQGNGAVDVADVILILRRTIGIGSW